MKPAPILAVQGTRRVRLLAERWDDGLAATLPSEIVAYALTGPTGPTLVIQRKDWT